MPASNGSGPQRDVKGLEKEFIRKETSDDDWVSFENLFREKAEVTSVEPPAEKYTMLAAGIPVNINHLRDSDDISDVSNVSNSTPFSVDFKRSCQVLPSIPQTGKFPDSDLASTAAIFIRQVMSDVVDNVTSSIDPGTLVEFQGRTRSLVRQSWNTVLEMKTESPENLSLFENLEQVFQGNTTSAVSNIRFPRFPVLQKSGLGENRPRAPTLSPRRRFNNNPKRQRGAVNDRSSPCERCGVEVSSEGNIVDFGQLGEEIEISRYHQASLLLDSRYMNTEISVVEGDENDDSVQTQIMADQSSKQLTNHRRKLVVPRLFRVKPQGTIDPPLLTTKISETSELRRDSPKSSTPRGSGKTVSTIYSDESTTAMQSMHTDESGWIQDPDIVRILQC